MKLPRNLLCVGMIILSSFTLIEKNSVAQDFMTNSVQLKTLDQTSIFNSLFKSEVKDWCLWKPTIADTALPVSRDGYCHTRLDTIFYFQQGTTHKALLIFGTYNADNGVPISCHSCAPYVSVAIFYKTTNKLWELEKYEKYFGYHGCWGKLPTLKLTTIGNQLFLEVDDGFMQQGFISRWNTYYHLSSLVLSLEISSSDDSGYYEEESKQEIWSEDLLDISEGTSTIVLVTKKGQQKIEGKGVVKVDETTKYILNDSYVFSPVKKWVR